ncbi:hypothetical protein P3T76_008707 [Phytophthora citrophthora]|uniref:Uncharacterized protein n=1 Tax=Phytophthora citrophthora TaxID=4793 RepID=A0AAD9LJS0_9STRA|nr:hypothetical protein P3T76_008707 [Phytophthora citrophthora]
MLIVRLAVFLMEKGGWRICIQLLVLGLMTHHFPLEHYAHHQSDEDWELPQRAVEFSMGLLDTFFGGIEEDESILET